MTFPLADPEPLPVVVAILADRLLPGGQRVDELRGREFADLLRRQNLRRRFLKRIELILVSRTWPITAYLLRLNASSSQPWSSLLDRSSGRVRLRFGL